MSEQGSEQTTTGKSGDTTANQQNAENAEQTTHETVDTNAGDDAVEGTIAEAEPTDTGDQKPMNE